jgi:bile salt-stimulated lipase
MENGSYLEINKEMDSQSMKEHLRSKYLQYWALTYKQLPTVIGEEAVPVPPTDDSQAAPVPPADDSEAAPVPPADDSQGAQMPVVIGF